MMLSCSYLAGKEPPEVFYTFRGLFFCREIDENNDVLRYHVVHADDMREREKGQEKCIMKLI